MIKLHLELKWSQERKSFLAFMFFGKSSLVLNVRVGGQANQKQFNPTMELKLHQPCLNATNFSFKIIIKAS